MTSVERVDIEILICTKCKGFGLIECRELIDYHRGEYSHWNELCKDCSGTGRLKQVTTTITEPYDNSEVTFLKLKDK